jgi:outer membrane immunogenic protein
MPYKAPRYKALPPMPFSWAGFYVGINGGYGWNDPTARITPADVPGATGAVIDVAAAPFDLSTAPKGAFVGGQIGYNWQFGQFVLGVEADYQYAWLKATASQDFRNTLLFFVDAGETIGSATLETRMDWFATFRGRFGYAIDRLLPYITAGAAVARQKSTVTVAGTHFGPGGFTPEPFSNTATVSETKWGLAFGGGLDWAITPNWILRGEYLYLRFPTSNYGALIPGVTSLEHDMSTHIVRAAINYRFAP